jgi:hypothetical protein
VAEIFVRNDRNFHGYGREALRCTYNSEIRVYESSAASGPHVWLNIRCDPRVLRDQPPGEGTAHLNEEQARDLVDRLQTWLDEIPSRWARPKTQKKTKTEKEGRR